MGMMPPWCSRWSSAAYERDSGTALRPWPQRIEDIPISHRDYHRASPKTCFTLDRAQGFQTHTSAGGSVTEALTKAGPRATVGC